MLQRQTRGGIATVGLSDYVERFYTQVLDELVDVLYDGMLSEFVQAFGIIGHSRAKLVWSQNAKCL
jgi:hypothetical protein